MLSILHRRSSGTDQTARREAYRQRLLEIAASAPVLSTAASGRPGAETDPPDGQFFSRIRKVEEKRPAPAGLDGLPVTMTPGLTERSSEAVTGQDRQATLNRDRLRTALGNLDSLAENVRNLDAEFGQICELCRAVQERIRSQAETVAALEQTVQSQAKLIETRVKAAVRQAGERFEALGKPDAVS